MSIISYVKLLFLLVILINRACSISVDLLNIKDTLIEKVSRKFINFDLPASEKKIVCLQFKYLTTDSNEAALLKLYLVKKKNDELSEKLWTSKCLFNKQKVYEELNIDTQILSANVDEYQLQFRLLSNQDETVEQLSIDDILDVNSVKINDFFCQSRYKCIQNDCLWGTFKNQTLEKNIIKLKNKDQINRNPIIQNLIQKLNVNLKDNNVFFIIHNQNKLPLNESIYSPVLKLPINLDEIEISFDCKSLNIECLPNENLFVEYKFAEEYFNLLNTPKQLIHNVKRSYKSSLTNERIDKFTFKLYAKNLIAKQADIIFWIIIKLKSNQTLVLSNIEVNNFLAKNLNWKKCDFENVKHSRPALPCNLEQFNSYDTDKVLNWSVVTEENRSLTFNYIKLVNYEKGSYSPNELYLPRTYLEGNNRNCVFKFKFNTQNDVNLFVYFVDDHKRQVKIWEKNEDALMISKNDSRSNWTDVSIYLGNIPNISFRLSFSIEQLVENSSIAIDDLEFENCNINESAQINQTKKPNKLDIIKISYEEPKPVMTNEQSTYKCDFEHTTLEQCGLYQDEVLEETCPEEFCTPSEFLKSLDNFDGMINYQLPFRDRSKNFGVNGHYIYLQNMNSHGRTTKAILRFKRTISNRLPTVNSNSVNKSDLNSSSTNACKMRFYLRTNGYSLVNYDIFVDLMTSNKLISIKTSPKFSKLNFYELNQVSFDNITEPFQVLIQGSIKYNYFQQDTFIYMAIDDLSFSKDCLFL